MQILALLPTLCIMGKLDYECTLFKVLTSLQWGPKFIQFHAVFGKIWQNRMLAPPPRGNSGSATALYHDPSPL